MFPDGRTELVGELAKKSIAGVFPSANSLSAGFNFYAIDQTGRSALNVRFRVRSQHVQVNENGVARASYWHAQPGCRSAGSLCDVLVRSGLPDAVSLFESGKTMIYEIALKDGGDHPT